MYLSIKGFRHISGFSLHSERSAIALFPHLKKSVYLLLVTIKNSLVSRVVFDITTVWPTAGIGLGK